LWLLYLYAGRELESLPILLWGLGFIFYGAVTFSRAFRLFHLFVVFFTAMMLTFTIGLGVILEQSRIILPATILVTLSMFLSMHLQFAMIGLGVTILYLFSVMTLGSVMIAARYGGETYFLLLGWTIIWISSTFYIALGPIPIIDLNSSAAMVVFMVGARRLEVLMPEEMRIIRYIERLRGILSKRRESEPRLVRASTL
jgi:hypothetical protein